MQSAGKRVHPPIIYIERRVCAIRNRVTKSANDYRVGGSYDVHRVEEEPRSGGELERKDVKIRRMVAASGCSDVRGDKGATVIGHRAAVAFDCVADSQVAPLDTGIIGTLYPRQHDPIAENLLTGRDRHRLFAAERHRCDSAIDEVA